MAKIELKRMLPFVSWDAEKRYGRSDDKTFYTLNYETAKTKAGLTLFSVNFTVGGDLVRIRHFTGVDDALEYMNDQVRQFARQCGWTPEAEVEPRGGSRNI